MEKKNNNLIGVIGDMHMKEDLSYADHISDGRVAEKKAILDFIVDSFKDCQHIIFMGDNFCHKNNSSEVNRAMVEFLEKFGKKDIYMISGNHETKGDGSTAIDFLKELKGKENWHIFTDPTQVKIEDKIACFLPYMLKSKLEVETNEEAVEKILKVMDKGDLIFTHHSISGTVFNGIKTETLSEIVLPKEKLEKKFKLVVAGHIHVPQQYDRVLITGSVFTAEVGEEQKYIWKIDNELGIQKIKIPQRGIYKLENPTLKQLTELPKDSIAKIVITDKRIDVDELKVVAAGLDAFLLIEDYPDTRKKAHIESGAFDFSIEALLRLYAKEKDISEEKLLKGLSLINN